MGAQPVPGPGHRQCLFVEEKAVPRVPARTTFLTRRCSLALRRVRPALGAHGGPPTPEFTERVGAAISLFTICTDFILGIAGWAALLHVLGEVY